MTNRYQDLSRFELPRGFRGAGVVKVQLWWLVQASIFRHSPQFAYRFRVWLLRLFGARIGKRCIIRPSVQVTYPWRLQLGDNCWVGDGVILYTLGDIKIGAQSVVSQYSHLCAADHDPDSLSFAIRQRPIQIGEGVWIATDVYIGTIVGARSSVFRDLPEGVVCVGSPCRIVKPRKSE